MGQKTVGLLRSPSLLVALFAMLALAAGMWAPMPVTADPDDDPEFTDDFNLGACKFARRGLFSAFGNNPWFRLNPGYQLLLAGEEDGEEIVVLITVLRDMKKVTFTLDGKTLRVWTRVVEEMEWEDGELVEVSRNYFARCIRTNAVYYFGEDVDDYEDGEIVGHGGAWLAGEDGALPGLIMPGTWLLGSRYMQEVAPGLAMDRAEHTDQGFVEVVEAGTFYNCVEVTETTPLEPGEESIKVYCPGVGLIIDDDIELAAYGKNLDPEEILETDLEGIGDDDDGDDDDDDDDDD